MSEPEARHRLVAMLAADAAGFSRVMAQDSVFLRSAKSRRKALRTDGILVFAAHMH